MAAIRARPTHLVMARLLLGGLPALGGLALSQPARADDRQAAAPGPSEAAQLIERLRRARDPDEREAAMRALAALGEGAKEALRAAAQDPDPELRFQALYLLQAADVRVERWVRTIAEGQAGDAGTYPAALEAREALLAEAGPDTAGQLVRILRRHPGVRERAARYAGVILDLLADVIRHRQQAGSAPSAQLAVEVCRLLELDLPEGFTEVVMVLDALPRDQALPALRGVLAGGTPLAKARAARIVGELLLPAEGQVGAALLQPLLRDPAEEVRLGALLGLDEMATPQPAFVPAVPLTRDQEPQVAVEALRILAARQLAVVREPAEEILGQRTAPLSLRAHAVVALGLLGQPGVEDVLLRLAQPGGERELTVLSSWALGAIKSPRARATLDARIADDYWAQEDGLYFGLARLGAVDALARFLDVRTPSDGARRARALVALGRCQGPAAAAAVDVLVRFALTDPLPANDEFEQVIEALCDLEQFSPSGCPPARAALARLFLDTPDVSRMDQLMPLLGRVGGPDEPELLARLTTRLQNMVAGGGVTRSRRESAADALARVNPEVARQEIRRAVVDLSAGGTDQMKKYARSLARSLARAGDPSFVNDRALVHSREEMNGAAPAERAFYMNNVGIDLLYGRRYDEAIVSFRQMLWSNPRDSIAAYNIACGHALAGRREEALRYLRRAIRCGYDDPRHLVADSDLNSLHADPRFQRLLQAMLIQEESGLPRPQDYWPLPR